MKGGNSNTSRQIYAQRPALLELFAHNTALRNIMDHDLYFDQWETPSPSQHFEVGLWSVLLISTVLWIHAYTNRSLILNSPATLSRDAKELTIKIVPLRAPENAMLSNILEKHTPVGLTRPKTNVVDLAKKPAEKEEDVLSDSALEIRAAMRSNMEQGSGSPQQHDSTDTIFSPSFNKLRAAAMPLNRRKKAGSGQPFNAGIDHTDSHGNLIYRAKNGCVFQQKNFGDDNVWWYVQGCEKKAEFTLDKRSFKRALGRD